MLAPYACRTPEKRNHELKIKRPTRSFCWVPLELCSSAVPVLAAGPGAAVAVLPDFDLVRGCFSSRFLFIRIDIWRQRQSITLHRMYKNTVGNYNAFFFLLLPSSFGKLGFEVGTNTLLVITNAVFFFTSKLFHPLHFHNLIMSVNFAI